MDKWRKFQSASRSLMFWRFRLVLLAGVLITVIVPVNWLPGVELIAVVFGEPRVSNHLAQGHALLRILDQEFWNTIDALATIELPLGRIKSHRILAGHPYRLLLRVMVEGKWRAQQRIQNAAERPQVTLIWVGLLIEDFWGDIPECPERLVSLLMGADHLC